MKSFGSKTNNSIDETVNDCIIKSMSIIEKLCPKNEVTKGLVERDEYHSNAGSSFSMLTSCQMLWAVTTAGTYAQSHYLVVDLLTVITKEINAGYFEHKDRSFERSFLLLATTAAPMQFQDSIYVSTIQKIIDSQNSNGYWGTYTDGPEDIRATALNIIALSECHNYVGNSDTEPYSSIRGSVIKACGWLESQYKEKGYCERIVPGTGVTNIEYTYGVELTAWSTFALIRAIECGCYTNNKNGRRSTYEIIKKSINWLIRLDYDRIATTPEIEQEIYISDLKNPTMKKKHGYGAGSLEVLVLALVGYRESSIYQYINDFDKYLQRAIARLTKNMNPSGEWYDKNTGSYSRAWTVSYALKALTTYQHYLDAKKKFKAQFIQNSKIIGLTIPKFIWKFKLALFFIIISIVAMRYGNSLTQYVEFLNSKTCTAIGFICTVLGFLMGFRK